MVLKTDFNWVEINILIGIKNCNKLDRITINKITEQLCINRSHPNLQKVMKYLIDEKIMSIIEIIGPVKIFEINYKRIRDLLDEQTRINDLVTKYIKKDHHFDW